MMSAKSRFIASIFFLGALQLVHAGNTVYKSVGPDGSAVYSDHPPANGQVQKTFEFADLPSTPVPDSQPVQAAAKRDAQKPQHTAPGGITLYSATWCGHCRLARAYLKQNGINYRNIDIDTAAGRALFVNAGGGGIPLLFMGGRTVRGFTADAYKRFLGGG